MQENVSLQPHNTFGIQAHAQRFKAVTSVKELKQLLKQEQPTFILGGGSNILLTGDVSGLVLKNEIRGINILKENKEEAIVQFGGGEDWHQSVLWALDHGLGGIENLSLIPGTIGAAPIQNIGAYGVELQHVFVSLEAVYLKSGRSRVFHLSDCQFGYRDSVFKRRLKGKVFITSVTLRLTKKHRLRMSYGAIQKTLEGVVHPTIQDVSKAIIEIRQSKLPDPAELGNSGSFFKNPEIPVQQFNALKQQFPDIVFYELPNNQIKVPAGWLIEQCGWKGKRVGNTGAHSKQSLVLVNYGGATGQEVWNLAMDIKASVLDKFGISIHPEVNIVN